MFKKVLIANRGEIALRVIRSLREMNIDSMVVCSDVDKDSLPVMIAGSSVCIGGAKATESYLNMDAIIEAALKTGCDAIHPGYGFLSENSTFARKCEEHGITFIGPSGDIIDKMGDKQSARELMIAHGVPVVPGSDGLVHTPEEAKEVAKKLGYPVLIKASAGGGGKGMRRVFSEEEMTAAYQTAKGEAKAAFGNDDMYIEKLIINPHHIEIQIIADKHGNVIYLGERDCSIQKNNQKLLEEAPSWFLGEEQKKKMGEIAVTAAKAVGYNSVGTIEFVVDQEENFYFIEMNTRVQVEHPVTEMTTGVDIIREQIRIASGLKLSYSQEDIKVEGHSIECRINALSAGKITFLHLPAGYNVRVDTSLYAGCTVSPYYDSMIAKVIVKGNTRLEAIRRMRRALEELAVEGIEHNAEFMYLLTYHKDFIKGKYDTSFFAKNSEEIQKWQQ